MINSPHRRTYTALETLTEPHQVVSTISCVTAVSRSLLAGGRYPEGRSHLFSILTLALPGIDPNDFKKTLVSALPPHSYRIISNISATPM